MSLSSKSWIAIRIDRQKGRAFDHLKEIEKLTSTGSPMTDKQREERNQE